eukprot:2384960-Lingulodinium_polyedra.AAC.1
MRCGRGGRAPVLRPPSASAPASPLSLRVLSSVASTSGPPPRRRAPTAGAPGSSTCPGAPPRPA